MPARRGLAQHPPVRAARIGAIGALLAAIGYAVLTGQAFATRADVDNCTCFGVFLPQRLTGWVLLQDLYVLLWARAQVRATWRWRPVRRGGRTDAGARIPDDDHGWRPVAERPIRVLLIAGSDRRVWSCPGYDSKARALMLRMAAALPRDREVDTEDLGNVERRAKIQSCNVCVSTSMALCVWPCNCYRRDHRAVPDLLWDRDLYPAPQLEAHVKVGGDLRPLEPGVERLYLGPRFAVHRRDAADAFLAGTGRPAEWHLFTSFITGFRWVDDFGVVAQIGVGPTVLWPLVAPTYEALYPVLELRVGSAWPSRVALERKRW